MAREGEKRKPLNGNRKLPAARNTLDDDVGFFNAALGKLLDGAVDEGADYGCVPASVHDQDAETGAWKLTLLVGENLEPGLNGTCTILGFGFAGTFNGHL